MPATQEASIRGKVVVATTMMTTAAMIAEDERLASYGAKKAEQVGIKTDVSSASRLIHERRKARKTA